MVPSPWGRSAALGEVAEGDRSGEIGALCAVWRAEVFVAQAVGVAFEREDLGVVDEPVDHRDGGDLVAEDLAPGRERFRDDESSLAAWVVEHEADLFFTKTLDWQTEHEYRVTLFPSKASDDGYLYVPFGGAESVRAVILGEHFPQSEVAKAESICQKAAVELLIAIWSSGAPRLVPSAWAAYRRPGGGFSEPLGPEDIIDVE
jgi:hypothetical protein